jgi:hypothetical protein
MDLEPDELCYHHIISPRIELLLISPSMSSFNANPPKRQGIEHLNQSLILLYLKNHQCTDRVYYFYILMSETY